MRPITEVTRCKANVVLSIRGRELNIEGKHAQLLTGATVPFDFEKIPLNPRIWLAEIRVNGFFPPSLEPQGATA
jgi:hypothetical protein